GDVVTHTFTEDGTFDVCVSFADDCGCMFSTCTQITVDVCSCNCTSDEEPPVFLTEPPVLVNVTCPEEIPEVFQPVVADNCDENPLLLFSETTTGDSCDLTITRTWEVTDACGH